MESMGGELQKTRQLIPKFDLSSVLQKMIWAER